VTSKIEAVVALTADFLDVILDRFGQLGGVDLGIPPRVDQPRAADFLDTGVEVIDPWRSR